MSKAMFYVSASVLAAVGVPAHAQDAGAETNEIVVTGQKRSESLQDISVAATVIGGDSLESKGVESFGDLQAVSPSLSITASGLTQSVNIRGVGLASGSPNASNGVATYFDGVFQPPIVSTNSFYDIGSVEVFRGPQGTFVGSNSTGGAIFINSKSPQLGTVEGYGQVEMGNYDRIGLEGAVNLPVGDTLAVRAAGIYRNRDSFYDSPAGMEPGSLDEKGGRLGVYWEPSTSFSALVKAEIADKSTGGYAYRPIVGTRYEDYRTADPYTLNYSDATRNDEKATQISTQLEYLTAGNTTFRFVGGYQNKRITNFYDVDATDATDLPRSTQSQFVREKVYTAEGNIISDEAARFRWIVGGYYQQNKVLVDITNNPDAFAIDIDIKNKKVTTGLFAQASYDLTDTLSIDVGGRYSTYDIDAYGAVKLVIPNIVVADPGGFYDDDQFTGKVAINFNPSPDHLFYAFVAKGYKSGGFSSPTTSFNPELVWDYEAGWKGTFGRLTTQIGGFYYDYSDFQLDALDPVSGRTSLINLTDATVKGVEGQFQFNEGGFDLSGGFAYTDSSLSGTEFVDSRLFAYENPGVSNIPGCTADQDPATDTCIDYSPYVLTTAGGPNLYSPKWTWNLSAGYTFAADTFEITPRVTYSHLGERYTYIAYDPVRDRLPAFDLVSANIAIDFDRFGFEIWATNLFDEVYSSGQTGNNEFYGAPREYGVRARMEF